jgi:flagellar biosynthesis protein FlhB
MIPQWDFWLFILVLLILVTYLVSKCVVHLRFNVGKKWVWSGFLVALYLGCMVASLGFNYFSNQQITFAKDMKNPLEKFQIESGWGANFSTEKRTEYSQSLARSMFINSGKFRDYIDLNGKLSEYKPTAADRQNRSELLHLIELIQTSGKLLFFLALCWLFIPLLGVGIGFTNWLISKLYPNPSFKRDYLR